MPESSEPVADEQNGYRAPIRRSLVEIPLLLGVPRLWCLSWVGVAMMIFFTIPLGLLKAILVVGTMWLLGHVSLAVLTAHEPQWPELIPGFFSESDRDEA